MPRYKTIQTAFSTGELTPWLYGRVDFNRYIQGCRTLENFIIRPHGGVYGRPGTLYVGPAKYSTKASRLIPFIFSVSESYVLEFGDYYFRVYTDEATVTDGGGSGFVGGAAIGLGAVASGVGAGPYVEIATPYPESVLFDLQYAQSEDTLYIVHKDYPPQKVIRRAVDDWDIFPVEFINGPYLNQNTDTSRTLQPSATTGLGITITAVGFEAFEAGHVGSLWTITHATTLGYARITAVTDSKHATADVLKDFGNNTAVSVWSEGAWSEVRGYPRAIAFFEQRLMFGGSIYQPQHIWGSVSDDFEDMTAGVADDDAVVFRLSDQKVNTVEWLAQARTMLAGTLGSEFAISGQSGTPLTSTSLLAKSQTPHGSAHIQPIRAGTSTMFVQRGLRKLYQLDYNFNQDAYLAPDLTLLSEHVTGQGIKELGFQAEPDGVIWAVLTNGQCATLTYMPAQQIQGWSRQVTDGSFESVAIIPHPTNGQDQVWFIVRRTINGATKRYIEVLDSSLYVDCALTYTGAAVSSVSGVDHLEAKTVSIQGDSATFPQATVTSGAVALSGATAASVQVGLPFTPTLTTLLPEVPSQDGTVHGRPMRFAKVQVRVLNSRGILVNNQKLLLRDADDGMGAAPALRSGLYDVSQLGITDEAPITITQTEPQPVNIITLLGVLQIGEL